MAPDLIHHFTLTGSVDADEPLVKGPDGHVFTRPVALWATTYGQLADDGSVVPTVDRQGQVMEAAKELGRIDWKPYEAKGLWNDRHDRTTIVGRPLTLDFHDGSSAFGQQHRKVGFHTTGVLFDRNDPRSFGDYRPSGKELAKADEFWELRHTPGALGGSVDGSCRFSPCRKRVVSATIDQLALHPTPHNPDAIATSMGDTPLEWLRKGMLDAGPCQNCVCPPGSCESLLKGPTEGEIDFKKLEQDPRWKRILAAILAEFPLLDDSAARNVLMAMIKNRMAKTKGPIHV